MTDNSPRLLDVLGHKPIVFDGAMGTELYARGGTLNTCFEALSRSQPALVRDVHASFVAVGVDVIETNTYGANRFALKTHGLENDVKDIISASVGVAREAAGDRAWVAGAMGPTGLLPKDLISARTRRQVFDAFRETISALVDNGIDALVFETFGYLGELEIAIEAAYGVNVPVIAHAAFSDALITDDGATPEEVVERLIGLGVDAVGANCVLGPERILDVVQRMVGKGKPVIMQPNVGYPRVVDGRSVYFASAETYGVVARRAFKLGVAGVGGCCGTSADHLRRVVQAARMLGGGSVRTRSNTVPAEVKTPAVQLEAVPFAERSRLAAKIAAGKFVASVEVPPPVGLAPKKTLERIALLDRAGIDAVNIPDGPRATVRMSNTAFTRLVLDELARNDRLSTGIEPIVHVCGRDRNLLALQSDLLGAHSLGIRNTVIITGDPPKVGDYPDASAVFDLDSIGILGLAHKLNHGVDPAGKAIGAQTRFVLATGAEPAALDFEREMKRLTEKRDAGAELIMTQPVFDVRVLERFLDAVAHLKLPILVGILPLASSRNAEFLHHNVPGMRIPDDVRKRMQQAGDGDAGAKEGVRIAAEALAAMKSRVQGTYIMPPFGRVELALEVLSALG